MLQLSEIVERIGGAQLRSMDQAHKDVADVGVIFGFIKQRVLSVKDRPLQTSFTDVVINRCPGLPQKEREPAPVFEQVADSSAQAGVRLDLLLFQLSDQPRV